MLFSSNSPPTGLVLLVSIKYILAPLQFDKEVRNISHFDRIDFDPKYLYSLS